MIRIHQGEEPPKLKEERTRRLARLWLGWHDAGKGHEEDVLSALAKAHKALLGGGYRVARPALRQATGGKCVYCEARLRIDDPLDHFRPKTRYPWLAWSWENLLPTCTTCNGAACKGSHFPVEGKSLEVWSHDITSENNLLLHPCREDPTQFLECVYNETTGWTLQSRDERGRETVGVLCLDTKSDRYLDHIHLLEEVVENLVGTPEDELQSRWMRVRRRLFGRESLFHLFTRAYLLRNLSSFLSRHGLALPELSDASLAPSLTPPFEDECESQWGSNPLAMAIRACAPKEPSKAQITRVLVEYAKTGGGMLAALEASSQAFKDRLAAPAAVLHNEGVLVYGDGTIRPASAGG